MDGLFAGFEQRRLSVNGVELNCRVGGQGPALLLLHREVFLKRQDAR